MDEILQAIAEPRRRDILSLIRERELSSGDIAAHFADVTRPAISQHLKVLLEAGLITQRRDGTRRLYRARPEGLAEVRRFLDEFWGASLQELKFAVEADEQAAPPPSPERTKAASPIERRMWKRGAN
jgi:DNA-binding transcriptional ArsR family regulator